MFQTLMNFTFTLSRPADFQWGAIQLNGSWSGMVGELATEKIDIGKNVPRWPLWELFCYIELKKAPYDYRV